MESMKNDIFKTVKTESSFSIYYYEDIKGIEYFFDKEKRTKYELTIGFMPFKATYSIDNKPIVELNSKDLISYEIPTDESISTEEDAGRMVRLDINLLNNLAIYGLPERAGVPELIDTTYDELYRLYNIDYFKYPRDQYLGLYGSWPFVLGTGLNRDIFTGLIWNNPSETYIRVVTKDNNKELLWISESGIIDVSFFADTDLEYLYYKYHKYIGFMEMPPMMALGYHQSRWNYKDTVDLTNVDRLFDENDIPYDTIWLDIEVMVGF
jgi:alpha-glucosidase (family GH31 glycosyl hydrolase)